MRVFITLTRRRMPLLSSNDREDEGRRSGCKHCRQEKRKQSLDRKSECKEMFRRRNWCRAGGVDWLNAAQDLFQWWGFRYSVMTFRVHNVGKLFTRWGDYELLKRNSVPWNWWLTSRLRVNAFFPQKVPVQLCKNATSKIRETPLYRNKAF